MQWIITFNHNLMNKLFPFWLPIVQNRMMDKSYPYLLWMSPIMLCLLIMIPLHPISILKSIVKRLLRKPPIVFFRWVRYIPLHMSYRQKWNVFVPIGDSLLLVILFFISVQEPVVPENIRIGQIKEWGHHPSLLKSDVGTILGFPK